MFDFISGLIDDFNDFLYESALNASYEDGYNEGLESRKADELDAAYDQGFSDAFE